MSSAAQSRSAAPILLMAPFVVLGSCLIFFITDGNAAVALAPLALPAVVWGILNLQLRTLAWVVLALCLFIDSAGEQPHEGRWHSPTYALSELLYQNLSTITGIGPLRMPLLDLLVFGVLGLAVWRRARKSTIDPPMAPLTTPMVRLMLLSLATLATWEVWGFLRGGNLQESFWQFRGLFLLPFVGFMFLVSFHGNPSDYRWTARIVIGAAIWKSIIGYWFLLFHLNPNDIYPEYATIHSDTVTYVWVMTLIGALLLDQLNWPMVRRVMIPMLFTLWGLKKNDRRLAYVSLGATMMMVFLMTPMNRVKRFGYRSALVLAPIIALYIGAGWNASSSGIFFGAQLVKSIVKGDQAQEGADYRDIEIFDILSTWNQMPLTGVGWGHGFIEPVKLPDISRAMPTYMYHPHNSFLFMWAVGGFLGVTGLWAWAVGVVFFAARSYRLTKRRDERMAALLAIATIIAHMNQCFGDIGIRSYNSLFLCGLAFGVIGKLAPRVGAWVPKVKTVKLAAGNPDSSSGGSSGRGEGLEQAPPVVATQ